MKNTALLLLAALALPACIINAAPPREVGSAATDGSVYLGWRLVSKEKKGANDRETFPVGERFGTFSTIRLTTDRPLNLAQVVVIFMNGEQWIARAPAALSGGQWSEVIALPGAPRAIHSVVVDGIATSTMHAKLEIHATR